MTFDNGAKAGNALNTETVPVLIATTDNASGASTPRHQFSPGQQFGGYRIVRLLGRGGMGTVYEAEHLETGRYLALKVLDSKLNSPTAKKRFLREGRLAAGINHPHSVYIFESDEIEGLPVIAMELIPGGNLEDHVKKHGPLPPKEAVDDILQVIFGLETAYAAGILHRDIKPSNCFFDAEGLVKIGDFGLSIPTEDREELKLTMDKNVLCTPAFASPEQLQGDKLDVRSDIYQVGMTLYYLLTGRIPFEAPGALQLAIMVLQYRPDSPAKYRSEIPGGLADVVLRCLEKDPKQRYQNYECLREALQPFGLSDTSPASLTRRFVAGCLDYAVLCGVMLMLVILWYPFLRFFPQGSFAWIIGFTTALFLLPIQYFGLTEGFWGASLGKALTGLRVVPVGSNIPSLKQSLIRAALLIFITTLGFWLDPVKMMLPFPIIYVDHYMGWLDYVRQISFFVLLALIFLPARKRNGFAALHDWLSETRVVHESTYTKNVVCRIETPKYQMAQTLSVVGPYHIVGTAGKTGDKEWLIGFDPRLLRNVWVIRHASCVPDVAAQFQNLNRPTRLRWLAGRRAAGENWDAYGALSGQSFSSLIKGKPQPWHVVRHWLDDLISELAAAKKDNSLPERLALDQLWVTADGRLVLLDFPAPGVPGGEDEGFAEPSEAENVSSSFGAMADPPCGEPQGIDYSAVVTKAGLAKEGETSLNSHAADALIRFLRITAHAALTGTFVSSGPLPSCPARPLPLHARAFLESLSSIPDITDAERRFADVMTARDRVTPWRRFALVAGCAFVPLALGLLVLVSGIRQQYYEGKARDTWGIRLCMERIEKIENKSSLDVTRDNTECEALKKYLAFVFFRKVNGNHAVWMQAVKDSGLSPKQQRILEDIMAQRKELPSDVEMERIKPFLNVFLERGLWKYSGFQNIAKKMAFFQKIGGNRALWTKAGNADGISPEKQRTLEDIKDQRKESPSDVETEQIKPFLNVFPERKLGEYKASQNIARRYLFFGNHWIDAVFAIVWYILFCVALPSMIMAMLCRGGLLLWTLRLGVVTADGRRAPRWRVFWRSVVTWSPVLLIVLWLLVMERNPPIWLFGIVLTVMASGAVWSVFAGERGPQDHIAGTALVPY